MNTNFIKILNPKLNEQKLNQISELIKNTLESPLKITFGILTYNEERCIQRCLNSITKYADEIIVLDTGSTDNTLKIVKTFKNVRIINYRWKDDFSLLRNEIIKQSKNDVIFFIDADEFLCCNNEINLNIIIYSIYKVLGTNITISPIIKNSNGFVYNETRRILNRKSKIKYYGCIHEQPMTSNNTFLLDFKTNLLIMHDGYETTNIQYHQKFQRNILLLKKEMNKYPDKYTSYFYYARDLYYFKNLEKCTKEDNDYYNNIILANAIKCYEIYSNKINKFENDTNICHNIILIILIYLEYDDLKLAENWTVRLKSLFPQCADAIYFEFLIKYKHIINELYRIRNSLDKKDTSKCFSFMYSNNSHINFLKGLISLSCGDYETSNKNLIKSTQGINLLKAIKKAF